MSLHQSFAQSFSLFNGRIEEGTYCPLKKYNFRHVIPLSKTTSIFREIFQLSMWPNGRHTACDAKYIHKQTNQWKRKPVDLQVRRENSAEHGKVWDGIAARKNGI